MDEKAKKRFHHQQLQQAKQMGFNSVEDMQNAQEQQMMMQIQQQQMMMQMMAQARQAAQRQPQQQPPQQQPPAQPQMTGQAPSIEMGQAQQQ